MFNQQIDDAINSEVLLVGNELLNGKTRDLNAFWLGKQMAVYGISIIRTTIIRDDLDHIAGVLKEVLERGPKYLFVCGGLGPTFDDLTIQGIANGLNKKLVLNEQALAWLKNRYEKLHAKRKDVSSGLNKARKKMAYLPEDAIPLQNSAGAAPGVMINQHQTTIFILPGIPREMQAIFSDEIAPLLKEAFQDIFFHERGFKVEKVGESTMAEKIIEIMESVDKRIWIKSHPKFKDGKYYIEMQITGYGNQEFEKEIQLVSNKVKKTIQELGGKIGKLDK